MVCLVFKSTTSFICNTLKGLSQAQQQLDSAGLLKITERTYTDKQKKIKYGLIVLFIVEYGFLSTLNIRYTYIM